MSWVGGGGRTRVLMVGGRCWVWGSAEWPLTACSGICPPPGAPGHRGVHLCCPLGLPGGAAKTAPVSSRSLPIAFNSVLKAVEGGAGPQDHPVGAASGSASPPSPPGGSQQPGGVETPRRSLSPLAPEGPDPDSPVPRVLLLSKGIGPPPGKGAPSPCQPRYPSALGLAGRPPAGPAEKRVAVFARDRDRRVHFAPPGLMGGLGPRKGRDGGISGGPLCEPVSGLVFKHLTGKADLSSDCPHLPAGPLEKGQSRCAPPRSPRPPLRRPPACCRKRARGCGLSQPAAGARLAPPSHCWHPPWETSRIGAKLVGSAPKRRVLVPGWPGQQLRALLKVPTRQCIQI